MFVSKVMHGLLCMIYIYIFNYIYIYYKYSYTESTSSTNDMLYRIMLAHADGLVCLIIWYLWCFSCSCDEAQKDDLVYIYLM